MRIGRNSTCPCGSGVKHKRCCLGKVDWDALASQPLHVGTRFLSLRGKNLAFLSAALDAVGVTDPYHNKSLAELKNAVTPEVVRFLFSLIVDLWPDASDLDRCIKKERSHTTAFYTGSYQPRDVFRAITRLSLYCDKILMIDPFPHPHVLSPKYSPLEHPEKHRATTIKFLWLWTTLGPWIDAGIVGLIRPIYDYDPAIFDAIMAAQDSRLSRHPELRKMVEAEVADRMEKLGGADGDFGEYHLLSHPDEALLEIFGPRISSGPFGSEKEFLAYIHKRRAEHPYYVDRLPGQKNELHIDTTGACYELAKRMCVRTESHLVTNLRVRWKEVEIDRQESGVDTGGWSRFAKALQEAEFKALDDVPIDAALRLRQDGRLASMRHFLRQVWKESCDPESFSETNALELTGRLREECALADEEWSRIDRDLLKWLSGTVSTLVSSGVVGFVPAGSAAVVTGFAGLADAQIKRRHYHERFPAGFFLGYS